MKLWAELFERLEHLKVGERLVVRHGVIAYDWMLGSRGIALQIRNEDTWRP